MTTDAEKEVQDLEKEGVRFVNRASGMTTDLSSKTVEELRDSVIDHALHSEWQSAVACFDEVARRLEAAQQQIAAEAKAEALEEAAKEADSRNPKEPAASGAIISLQMWLEEKAAEYRAKAGRKE